MPFDRTIGQVHRERHEWVATWKTTRALGPLGEDPGTIIASRGIDERLSCEVWDSFSSLFCLFVCLFFVCFHNYSKHKIGKRVMVIPNYQITFLLVQKLYNLLFKSCLLNNSLLDNSLLFDRTQVWWFQLPILYQSCAKMIGVFASLVGQILFLVLKNFRNSGSGFFERHDPDIPKWKTCGSKTCSRKTWWLT